MTTEPQPKPIPRVNAFLAALPELNGREEALAYLEGHFVDLVEAAYACPRAGIALDPMLCFDLAHQARLLARIIREDLWLEAHLVDQPAEAAASLSRALRELVALQEKAGTENLDEEPWAIRGLSRAVQEATAQALEDAEGEDAA